MNPAENEKLYYWLFGTLILSLGTFAFFGTVRLHASTEEPTGMSKPPGIAESINYGGVTPSVRPLGSVNPAPPPVQSIATPVLSSPPGSPQYITFVSDPGYDRRTLPAPNRVDAHPVLIYVPPSEVEMPATSDDSGGGNSSEPAGSRVLSYPQIWLASLTDDERGQRVSNMPVRGGMTGSQGDYLLEATFYNPSNDSVWIVPARLTYDDGSAGPLFRWSDMWTYCSDGVIGKAGDGACYSPTPASSQAVELRPNTYTVVPVFSEKIISRKPAGGMETAGFENHPITPRALVFAVVKDPDRMPAVPDMPSVVDRLRGIAAAADRVFRGADGPVTLFQVPATPTAPAADGASS